MADLGTTRYARVLPKEFTLAFCDEARSNGWPWDMDTCLFGVLERARSNRCPWDEDTCSLCVDRSESFPKT